jgi:LmbE family N-acetylglucosaminyl deacetylase
MMKFKKTKSFLQWLKNISLRYRKIIIFLFVFWGIWTFGLGALSGWLLSKGGLEKFPGIQKNDQILIIAPHIDDEAISSAGLIQQALNVGAKVKIIYMTNGDDNLFSIAKQERDLRLNPNDFIKLGEKRMSEGEKATQILGLKREDLFFLGYPDRGLYLMFNNFYNTPYSSQGTKLTYNPYNGTYKTQQNYTGSNVTADLEEIIKNFQPTIIIVSHPRDKNSDHRATYFFLNKVLNSQVNKTKIFAYLVHYSFYPPQRKLSPNEFLYPPKKLFSQKGWFSFDLSSAQEKKKLVAIEKNSSQKEFGQFYDLLHSFIKRNEIFEEMESF